jgi:hypothetical protein
VFQKYSKISDKYLDMYHDENYSNGWYSPSTHVEKLYMLRLQKMVMGILMFRSNTSLDNLTNQYKSNAYVSGKRKEIWSTDWQLSFPHETRYLPLDHHFYNSFYVCKTLSILRHDKAMSEALVLLKQIKNRKLFLKIQKETDDKTALRNLPQTMTKKELLTCDAGLFIDEKYNGKFRPSYLLVLLSSSLSVLRLNDNIDSVEDCITRYFKPLSKVLYKSTVSSAMNNRGSVADVGKSMAVPTYTHTETINTKIIELGK